MKARAEKLFTVRQKDADRKRAGMHPSILGRSPKA